MQTIHTELFGILLDGRKAQVPDAYISRTMYVVMVIRSDLVMTS